jgi:hypothetical protein
MEENYELKKKVYEKQEIFIREINHFFIQTNFTFAFWCYVNVK